MQPKQFSKAGTFVKQRSEQSLQQANKVSFNNELQITKWNFRFNKEMLSSRRSNWEPLGNRLWHWKQM